MEHEEVMGGNVRAITHLIHLLPEQVRSNLIEAARIEARAALVDHHTRMVERYRERAARWRARQPNHPFYSVWAKMDEVVAAEYEAALGRLLDGAPLTDGRRTDGFGFLFPGDPTPMMVEEMAPKWGLETWLLYAAEGVFAVPVGAGDWAGVGHEERKVSAALWRRRLLNAAAENQPPVSTARA